ncbi:MAG: phospho-sugar mutase [Acholeplasmatales bacterium]|jgi:phosphoglucomutase|nr:phospho-sugar mutase [Acholeplasmataceae bacterium]MCK9233629.1 phospho-sugar mutase [Acholeplasmataceae bacterium]MCK9289478.1 phospho-sugar mutase [Acholeplasmataceae bacterium]MCK9427907.1 phospho-sugar mutase [Acholeplasmataceae bacterium]MDY0115256.1 phospho-sugar mutase [Acholeplasmatales bacterium]
MAYQSVAKRWENEKSLPKNLKNELLKMNQEELKEAFYQDLAFGTGGIRGIMGVGVNRLNVFIVKKVALGFANYLKKNNPNKQLVVAISFDNRINSNYFAQTIAKVLAAQKITVYLTKELRPTPYLSFMVRHFKADGGLMVTASHNPKEYNGIKAYDKHGGQMMPFLTDALIKEINLVTDYFNIKEVENNLINIVDESFDNEYLKEVYQLQLKANQAKPFKFIYTPLHGTGGTLIEAIKKQTNYLIYPLQKQMIFDGSFPNTKSSNPEDEIAYELALEKAKEENADAILATDPDADRLGIVVKHEGEYLFLNGNQTVALQVYYLLSELKKMNKLPDGVVYYSNVTTPLIKNICDSFEIESKEVLTGFKYIGDAILNSEKPFLFGAEESYGSLVLPFVRDKDAIQAVLMLIEMVTFYLNQNKTLRTVLLEIYQKYGYYQEKNLNFTYPGIKGKEKITKIMNHYYQHPPKYLLELPIKVINHKDQTITEANKTVKSELEFANVIKYVYSNREITFRPSGTEPKLKVYLHVKGKTLKEAEQILTETVAAICQESEEF